ncbi:MAG: type II secretion system protein [Phycisphaerales bacterium]
MPEQRRNGQRRGGWGFTLVELLVVIAIIGLLISILLPALKGSREAGRQTVCMSNVRQIMTAMTNYAMSQRCIPGTYWQGAQNLDWAGRQNTTYLANPAAYRHPLETSVLKDYLERLDRIMECPTAKRDANAFFDYTVIIRMAGARTDLEYRVTYPTQPQLANSPRMEFQSIPILMEEHPLFYNRSFDDGSFAAQDQLALRHGRAAHIGFLDCSVALFKAPAGGNPDVEEAGDLKCSQLRLVRGMRTFPLDFSNAQEFGWVNKPR